MFIYLILLFTILPALELYFLLKVGSIIGAGNTILIIILTGVIGAYLARLQGFLILRKIQTNLNQGIMPNNELLDGLMILVGGIVLLTPGFITDILGFLLLIPLTRSMIKLLVSKRLENTIKKGGAIHIHTNQNNQNRFNDIDI